MYNYKEFYRYFEIQEILQFKWFYEWLELFQDFFCEILTFNNIERRRSVKNWININVQKVAKAKVFWFVMKK